MTPGGATPGGATPGGGTSRRNRWDTTPAQVGAQVVGHALGSGKQVACGVWDAVPAQVE